MALAELQTAALLSLAAALLVLVARASPLRQPQRSLGGPGAALAELLLAALDRFDVDGRRVLQLATRTNIILLCNAILFLVLWDAGILAPRRNRAAAAAAVAGAGASPRSHSHRSAIVWRWRPRRRAAPASVAKDEILVVTDVDRLKQHRRGPRSAALPPLTGAEHGKEEPDARKQIVLGEQRPTHPFDNHRTSAPHSCDEKSKAEDETECAQEQEEDVDVEEMNRRFDEFIAATRRKMQLEVETATGQRRLKLEQQHGGIM
ncbi:hypothetical protein ACP70R_046398 [Stipagrostis hirtigluma subsp. patula]